MAEGEDFGQEKPPLLVTVKRLLDKYPDGQIFKEIIQNADDAKAEEVKFVLDHRQVSTISSDMSVSSSAESQLSKFCAPALLAFNNALFSEKDWKSIQKLHQSVKAENPFKVGKFGIGFNSVYHITDLPVLISGKFCAFFDPQEHIWKSRSGGPSSGKKFTLTELHRKSNVLDSFNGICGFTKGVKNFKGTLFCFPLRKVASKLSKKCYDPEQVKALSAVLRDEANYLLLFLRSVKKIGFYHLYRQKQMREVFKVTQTNMIKHEVTVCDTPNLILQCPSDKQCFAKQVCEIFEGADSKYMYSTPKVVTGVCSVDVVVTDQTGEHQHHWLVVQQVGSSVHHVRDQAKEQCILPWVGTAIETTSCTPCGGGRLFCFLPMPREATAPVPVAVNGTFALNDNRRSLKLPAAERKGDTEADWNMLLIEHCLPSCYVRLLLNFIEMNKVKGTSDEVYRAWPNAKKIHSLGEDDPQKDWSLFLKPFFTELFTHKVVFAKSCVGSCWVSVDDEDVIFNDDNGDVPSVVVDVLLQSGLKVAKLVTALQSAINYLNLDIVIITPEEVRYVLKNNLNAYQDCSSAGKLALLNYCLKDGDYADLVGLELLPLHNGEYIRFTENSQNVDQFCYLCKDHFLEILCDCHHLLVNSRAVNLEQLAESGCTQVQKLEDADVARLLRQHMPEDGYDDNWLETFWTWVTPSLLHLFKDLPLLPVGQGRVALLKKSAGVVFVPLNKEVKSHLSTALHKYKVQMVEEIHFRYLQLSPELMSYVHQFDGPGVLDAISCTCSETCESIELTAEEASALQVFLDDFHRNIRSKKAIRVLCRLAIFHVLQYPCGHLVSINSVKHSNQTKDVAIAEKDDFDLSQDFLPRAPLVLSQAYNQPSLLQAMEPLVKFMTKMSFLCEVLLPMIDKKFYFESKLERFMMKLLKDFKSLIERYPTQKTTFTNTLKELHFLKNTKREWKSPKEMYDPKHPLICSLFKGKDVFPVPPFNSKDSVWSLKQCGLRGLESVTAQCIVNIIEEIGKINQSHEPIECDSIGFERAHAVFKFFNNHQNILDRTVVITKKGKSEVYYFTSALKVLTANYCWLPVCSHRPSNYPSSLPWKGSQYSQHLASSQTPIMALDKDCEHSDMCMIMGSEMLFLESCPSSLAKVFSSSKLSFVSATTAHLETVICKATSRSLSSICPAAYNFLDSVCKNYYKKLHPGYSQSSFIELSDSSSSSSSPWYTSSSFSAAELKENAAIVNKISCYRDKLFLLVGKTFVKPSQVARSGEFTGPYLYSLPDNLVMMKYLRKALGIKDKFNFLELVDALNRMYQDYGSRRLPKECCNVVKKIMGVLSDCDLEEIEEIYLPDESYRLCKACDLCVREPWYEADPDCKFVCERLARNVAIKLGVKTVSSRFLQQYVSNEQPFGQREDLIRRLKNILSDYPLDHESNTFLKELLQNADDAKATKMCVILDKRTHSSEHVLSENWSELQGPALLVWNNAEFSKRDLKGIQQLGLGSKHSDSESIGQFGIGFNVVYHITDCPSFITGGTTLCILDPYCRYAPRGTVTAPGRRFDKIDEVFWNKFSGLKKPYLRDQSRELQGGSLFRFPLRQTASDSSEEFEDGEDSENEMESGDEDDTMPSVDIDELEGLLNIWVPQVKESLLFLNHVTHFSFYIISEEHGKELRHQYEVHINEVDLLKRSEFYNDSKLFRKNMIPQLITYHLFITSTSGKGERKATEEWLVQQGVGDISGNKREWSFLKNISPRHGLAAPLSPYKEHTFSGKAFCFLPLPINTNLPIHVNGQFILSKSRRSLWISNEQDRSKNWNDNLIEAISSSYAHFLVIARQYYVQTTVRRSQDLATALSRYYQLFPYLKEPFEFSPQLVKLGTGIGRIVLNAKKSSGSKPENVWKTLCEQTFKKLWTNNAEVLAFCERNVYGFICGKVKWHVLHNSEDPYNQAYFAHNTLEDSLEQLLVKLGMVVSCAPIHLRKHFKDVGYNPMVCSSIEACSFYITFHEQILQRRCPVPIAETPFQIPSQFLHFTLYVTQPDIRSKFRQYCNSPFGHPLLLTADNYIRVFDENSKVIDCDFSHLFPDSLYRFLHPCMAEQNEQFSPKYFSSEEPLSKVTDILKRNLPPSLFDVQRVDNSNGELILWDKLQLLWICLCYTPVFNQHKQAIFEQFAIIPTFIQHLYSTKSSVLPLVLSEPYRRSDQSICSEAYHVLRTLGLPVIDASKATLLIGAQSEVLDIIKQYCVDMSDRAKVLMTLYYFHIETRVLTRMHVSKKKQVSETLFKYFQGILLSANNDSKEHIESLPLFKTVSGTYTSVWKKSRFIWPDGCCMAGYDKWADTEDVVLLKGKQEWKTLYHCLNVRHLSQKDVYVKFILNAFEKLNETERKAHLLYIKDSLFDTIVLADHDKFLNQMKEVPCLEDPDGNGLLPVSHFSDPDVEIFQMFAEKFKFPSAYYRSEEWLTFFKKIGLKTTLETNELVSLCELVASGDHTSTEQASNCLKQYLFSYETFTWLADASLLERIGNICFVRPNLLHELDWIKPPCSPVNRHLNLTTLKGAAVSSCARLVWTLMPIVSVPSVAKIPNSLSLKEKLGMVINPSARDIYTNILSISQTGLADFKLFETYRKEFICKKNDLRKTSIVVIMCECLKALYKHGDTGYDLLKDLVNVPCIPVSADSMDNYVLVNSFQVVLSMNQSEVLLKPYINELPTSMHAIFTEALSRIGVTSQIEVKHLEYMLETIHNQIGAGEIQTNQLLKVRTAVLKLTQICADNLSQRNSLTCLYLPCHERTLVKSTTLLVDDSKRYEDVFHLDFTSTSYRIFVLPPCLSYGTSTMNMPENDVHVCQSLPEKLRPKSLTVFIDERIVEGAKVVENTDLCDQVVEMAQFHQHIQLGLFCYLEAEHSDMKVQLNRFSTEIGRILTLLEVKAIMNLEAQLFLTLDNPPSFLGTRKVQFILVKNLNGSFLLYLDSLVASSGSRKYWRELSQSMCIQAARNSNSDPATFLTFSKSLSEFLQIRNLDDLRELTRDLSVSYDDMDTPFSLPQLGAKVFISDCHQDINNIFRAQEWVAYEVSEGQFIFAIVLYPILPSRGEDNADLFQRKYLIQFGKKEDEVLEVSSLDLYKLIDHEADHEEVTNTTELDATRHVNELHVARHAERRVARHPRSVASSSPFATRKKLTDKQKLKELKKKICEDLRKVWTLPEKDRRKALKRLFLHYHPDKAKPEEVGVYEEAFKFLQRQIHILESGQNMDDPDGSSTCSDTPHSTWSGCYPAWNETAQNMHRGRRQRRQERRKGFSGYQPTPNSVEANRWLRQAKAECCSMMVLKHSVRTTPDTASMLCFVAHQVVEKALKAGMYKLFGLDPTCLLHHQLSCHAAAIYSERPSNETRDLCATSAALEEHYIQARYPNAHDLPTAPVDIYTIQQAEHLADLAKQALEIIQKLMM